ncbi:unnamed protein product, partial [Rotaria magnacalcarata]
MSHPPSISNGFRKFQTQLTVDLYLIVDVRECHLPDKFVQIFEQEINLLCEKSKEVFLSQPMLLELEAPIKICGNIYGQYTDLLRHFESGGFPPKSNYLFLGNYIDRGRQSLETICLLLAYKPKYPDNIFLLRGNHECASINRIYGFYDECKRRYNIKLWKSFNNCFNCLPVAAIVAGKIFCCQGGLSPDLHSLEQIQQIQRPIDVPDTGEEYLQFFLLYFAPQELAVIALMLLDGIRLNNKADKQSENRISRSLSSLFDLRRLGLLCGLLWSDPDNDLKGWSENDAGISLRFGVDIVNEFLNQHKMDLICRAHKVVKEGYAFFADRRLVTVFSAPNYLGSFGNAGALMSVDKNLICSFMILHSSSEQANKSDDKNLEADCLAQSVSENMINPPVTKVDSCQKCVSWTDTNE